MRQKTKSALKQIEKKVEEINNKKVHTERDLVKLVVLLATLLVVVVSD